MIKAKTNAMRILEKEKIRFETYSYEVQDGKIDGVSVAHKLGVAEECVFKTLVARGAGGEPCVFVIPVRMELNLKAAARAVGEKSVSMLKVSELLPVTGYIRGGCSPVGMKKTLRTVIDTACEGLPSMLVSAGKIGLQVALDPKDLIAVTGASVAPIAWEGNA